MIFFSACHSKKTVSISSDKNTNYIQVKNILWLSDKEMQMPLYAFIVEWYGVPYKYGTCTKNGTDCSGFVNILYQKLYNQSLSRSADEMYYKDCKKISIEEVKEGDLVFFQLDSKKISHVGVCLRQHKFVHASTKKGVMISDLNEPYFQKCFFAFGRVQR